MKKIVIMSICIMLMVCCAAAAQIGSEYYIYYKDGERMKIDLRHGGCQLDFFTAFLPDPESELEPIEGYERQDRHFVDIHLTVEELRLVEGWFDRHDFFGQGMNEYADTDSTISSADCETCTDMTVGQGPFARNFSLDRDQNVAPELRDAEAEFLALCFSFVQTRLSSPVASPYASILTGEGAATSPRAVQPDPSRWKEPRLFHQPFDRQFSERIIISKSDYPAALLTPVHSPNKAYYYMTIKPDFTREGPWHTDIYIYAEQDQLTRVELLDHANQAPAINWINEKLLSIRVWWGRQLGTDLIIDVESAKIISKEMVVDGRILFEQHAESTKALEEQGSGRETDPDQDQSIAELRQLLQSGTPQQKEAALDRFSKHFPAELVPDVIAAILDDTRLPRREDTGWGTVHHHAATVMGYYAQRIDGLTQKERGRYEYSFFDDGGVATPERRQEVHDNWLEWWEENKLRMMSE